MGIVFSLIAFAGSFGLGRVSLAAGLGSVITVGYLYGILRANYLDSATYFLFDAAVVGFYLSLLGGLPAGARNTLVAPLRGWTLWLIVWAVIMFLLPLQHPLIQLVGLRGNAFLVPFLVVGGWLRRSDARQLALWLAALNLVAFAFALVEYVIGVPAFFPRNQVTELIYRSGDLSENTAYRIPACFSNAHSYGGAMVSTLPWLLGAWVQPRLALAPRALLASGVGVAMLGVFMCAARTHIVLLALVILLTTFSGNLHGASWLGWVVVLAGIGTIVSGEERMQRFLTLGDTDYVMTRIEGSVNLNFLELLAAYPLGNGMGAGGTSIPYFLQHLLRDPIGLENEYSRILLEQGLPGLLLWFAFIMWCVGRRPKDRGDPWHFGKHVLWVLSLVGFATALTGTGLMTAIPQSTLFFLGVGFAVTPQPRSRRPQPRRERREPTVATGKLETCPAVNRSRGSAP